MTDLAVHMELEDGVNTSVKELVQAIVSEEQLGLSRSATNIFTLWMCSGLLGKYLLDKCWYGVKSPHSHIMTGASPRLIAS